MHVTSAICAGPLQTTEVRTGSTMLAQSGHCPRGCGGSYLRPLAAVRYARRFPSGTRGSDGTVEAAAVTVLSSGQ